MLKNKRAQITLFIIIGIIILLSTITIIYIRSKVTKEETGVEQFIEETPNWAKPVAQYIDDCIKKTTIKAFKMLGEHGGFIDMNDEHISGRTFNLNKNPTESDAVSLSTTEFDPIPYWWYLLPPTDCIQCKLGTLNLGLQMYLVDYPNFWTYGLMDMEQQVDRYINRELSLCINDFQTFREQGFQFSYGDIVAYTSINKNDISINLDYPITITKGQSTIELSNFNKNLDLNLWDIYELSLLITLYEKRSQTLEEITKFLIDTYASPPSKDKIPPMSWPTTGYSSVTWQLPKVEPRLRNNVLGSYIPSIQINQTREAKHITVSDKYEQGAYDVMFLDFLNTNYPHLSVNFLYNPEWEQHLDITPRTGGLLKPDIDRSTPPFNLAPPTQITYYEFFYDISYPVVVIIRDHQSLKKQGEDGYTFMFALEVNLRDNKNLLEWNQGRGTIGMYDYSSVIASYEDFQQNFVDCTPSIESWTCPEGITTFAGPKGGGGDYKSESDCEDTCAKQCLFVGYKKWTCPLDGSEYSDEVMCGHNCYQESKPRTDLASTKTLFCDPEQRISGDITIKVTDGKTGLPVEDVAITHGCGNAQKCPMEATNNYGTLSSKFPVCIGDGHIILEKDGYMAHFEPHVTTRENEQATYNIILEPLREKQVEAVYINVTNLFRIKRKLYVKKGNNILDDLYHETKGHGFILVPPIVAWGHGILGELYREAWDRDLDTVRSKIGKHAKKILYARKSIKRIKYYYELNTQKVVDATYIARDAAEYAWSLVNDGTLPLGEPHRSRLEEHRKWLNKEIDNIQFLKGSDVYSLANVNKHRLKANHPNQSQHAEITCQKVKENIYEQEILSPVAQVYGNQQNNITIVPGRYIVTIRYEDDDGLYMPAQGYDPEYDYAPAYLGGAHLSNTSSIWHVDKSTLDSNNKIRFYFFKIDDPEMMQDLGELGELGSYSKKYRSYIKPELLP